MGQQSSRRKKSCFHKQNIKTTAINLADNYVFLDNLPNAVWEILFQYLSVGF